MAVYQLTSPQGEKYQVNAPDDATQDQVMRYFQQNSGHPDFKSVAQPSPVAFGSNRGVSPTNANMRSGEKDFGQGVYNGIKEAPFWLNDLTNAETQGITRLAGATQDNLTPEQAQGLTNPAAPATSQDILKAAGMPVTPTQGNLGAMGNIAGNMAAMPAVGAVIDKAGDLTKSVGSKIAGAAYPPTPPMPLSVDMLNRAAPNAYGVVNNADTGFSTNFGTKGANIIEQAKETPISGMELTSEQAGVNKMLDEYKGLGSQPLTLSDYQKLDSTLGRKAAQAYISSDSDTARIIGGVQDKIRDMVKPENLNPADITGSPEGINTLTQDAIPMWSVKRKIEDLQAIVDNANMTKNPQTAMMTGFKNYIKSGRAEALPPEVQQLVQQMATQGTGADLLSIVGSRLNPVIAGAAGGPAAGIVAQGTSLAARAIGNRVVNNRADAIINSMLEQVRPSIEKFHNYQPPPAPAAPPAAPMLALPAPEVTNYVNKAGQNVPLTPAGREIIGQAPAAPPEPTLQEIQNMPPQQATEALDNYLRRLKQNRR